MNRGMWLGFFFIVALILLLFATLVLGQIRFHKPLRIKFHFDKVEGLRKGDDIRIDGLLAGKVHEISLDVDKGGVKVVGHLNQEIKLYKGYAIYVESFTLLGGNYISIHRGAVGTEDINTRETLIGWARPSAFEEMGTVLKENKDAFKNALTSLNETAQEFKGLASDLRSGKGTLGKLFTDTSLLDQASATLKEGQLAMKDVREAVGRFSDVATKFNSNEGTLGKLLTDPSLFNEVKGTFTDARAAIGELRSDMKTAVNDLKEMTKAAREISDKITKGDGLVGRVINDPKLADDFQKTIENLRKSSESIDKVTSGIAEGKGTIGRLLQEDTLYEKAKTTLDSMDKVVGRAARAKVYVAADYRAYPDSEMTVTRGFLRIVPDDTKYFHAGVSILGFSASGPARFEEQIKTGDDDSLVTLEAYAFYKLPWFLDNHLGLRAGIIEGRAGAALDFDFDVADLPLTASFEIRDAYSSVEDEDFDEEIEGAMTRLYLKSPLWTRGATDWWQKILYSIKMTAGMSNMADDPEFFVGIGFEYEDEDIRTLVGLVGTSR